ncbi:hypothetical protein Pelo_3076 [Pelomyxa schiedti]|nr:hypothetical protein Pelo_3076 [Pelomyxa schiedti]
MCRVAEAMFPLVGRVCRSLLRHYRKTDAVLKFAAEAGSRRCVDWMLKHRDESRGGSGDCGTTHEEARGWNKRVRRNKEFWHVLSRSCAGGHLGMARLLVDGRWPGLVWDSGGFCGALVDHVRASRILRRVCEKGHGDVAKWLVETFNFSEPWEFVEPFCGAVSGGFLDLAQWIVDAFDLIKPFHQYTWMKIHVSACLSGKIDVVKWCFETFPFQDLRDNFYRVFINCLSGKKPTQVEVCKYVSEHILRQEVSSARYIHTVEILKWVLSTYPSFSPTQTDLEHLCMDSRGFDLIKWLVEESLTSVTPNPGMFIAACQNPEDDVKLAQWLSTKVTLSPDDLRKSFSSALARNNTSIASWMNATFQILSTSTSGSHGIITGTLALVEVCKALNGFADNVEGVKWLLNHAEMKGVEESLVVETVENLVHKKNISTVPLLLIEKFPIPEPKLSEILGGVLTECVQGESISQAKKITSMSSISKESIARSLGNTVGLDSTKTVKWLITQFQLEREHITLDGNHILFNLIMWGQENCAEWLIDKFNITLDEVSTMCEKLSLRTFLKRDLFLWQMLLAKFPDITATFIKEKLMYLVCQSPAVAQYTMRHFPELTTEDILVYCSAKASYEFLLPTRCWMRSLSQTIWQEPGN